MIKLADVLGRVMMTAVNLPRSSNAKEDGFRRWAEVEYPKDKHYVYDCLVNNRKLDMR